MNDSVLPSVWTSIRRTVAASPYVRMIRDIQRWYDCKEGHDGTALHTALLLVSALMGVGIMVVTMLSDVVVHGELQMAHWSHRAALWLLGVVYAFHLGLLRLAGVNGRVDVGSAAAFPASAKIYIAVTAIAFGALVAAVAYTRH